MNKIRRPKVNLPSEVKITAMMLNKGKKDRTYIKLMTTAIASAEKHKLAQSKQINNITTDE